jgi:hypothetical protein
MEDGEAKLAVKMSGLLVIYGGVKELREIVATGELSTESKDFAKFLADANQLAGNTGFFGNIISQQYVNKYGNNPLDFFPAASTLTKSAEAIRSIDVTDPFVLTPEIKKIRPIPKVFNLLEKTFGEEVYSIEKDTIEDDEIRSGLSTFRRGGLVTQMSTLNIK